MSNDILRSKSEVSDGATQESPGDEETVEPITAATTAEEAFQRARLYALLSIGFDRPGEEFERLLESGVLAADVRTAGEVIGDEDLIAAAETVATAAADADPDDCYYEWGSLFGVEEGVTVSQYEMTYMPGPLLTSSRDLADIAGFYRAFDLSIAEGENDRKDHLCLQLEFLSHLCLREAHLREEGDDEGVHVVVGARRAFVEDHLGRWFWRFADEVCKRNAGFHARLTDLLSAFVEAEIDLLDVDPDWVPDDPEVVEWNEDIFGDSGRGCGGCGIGDRDAEDELQEMGIGGEIPSGPPGTPDSQGPDGPSPD